MHQTLLHLFITLLIIRQFAFLIDLMFSKCIHAYTRSCCSFPVPTDSIPLYEQGAAYLHSLDEHLDCLQRFCSYKLDMTHILVNASRCIRVRVSLEVELLDHRVYTPY